MISLLAVVFGLILFVELIVFLGGKLYKKSKEWAYFIFDTTALGAIGTFISMLN